MKIALTKDLTPLRAAAVQRVYAAAGAIRARFATQIPAQDMIYLEKAAEARRFLATYPTLEDDPGDIDSDPVSGYPFIAAELGITPTPAGRWRVLRRRCCALPSGRRGDRRHPARHRQGDRARRHPGRDRRGRSRRHRGVRRDLDPNLRPLTC